MKLLYFALLLAVCLAPTQEKSVAESPVEASSRHVTVINVGNGSELQDQTATIRGNRIALHRRYPRLRQFLVEFHRRARSVAHPRPLGHARPRSRCKRASPLHRQWRHRNSRHVRRKRYRRFRTELARQRPSPEIYLASAIVDGRPPIWPGSIVIKKPDEARRSVDEIKANGADFIKVYMRVPRDAYFGLAAEAKKQRIDFLDRKSRERWQERQASACTMNSP